MVSQTMELDKETLALLRRTFKTQPSAVHYQEVSRKKKGLPCYVTLQKKVGGGSWNQAWALILNDENALKKNKVWTKEEIIETVKQANIDLNYEFSNKRFEDWRKQQNTYTPSVRTIERNFGSLAELCKLLDIPYKSVKKKSDFTKEDIAKAALAYIQSIPDETYPTALGYRAFQKENPHFPSQKIIARYFETWKEVLKFINYDKHQDLVNIKLNVTTKEDCLRGIQSVFNHIGYPLTSLNYTEFTSQNPGLKLPNRKTILKFFDSWDEAVIEAGLTPRKELDESDILNYQHCRETSHATSVSVGSFLNWCLD